MWVTCLETFTGNKSERRGENRKVKKESQYKNIIVNYYEKVESGYTTPCNNLRSLRDMSRGHLSIGREGEAFIQLIPSPCL